MTTSRQQQSYRVRVEAAEVARGRVYPEHRANGDERRFASAHYAMSFTKGLAHCEKTGLIQDPAHFETFRAAIDVAEIDPFTVNVPVPQPMQGRRQWEAPTAGVVYDLQGPDAQAVTMPPAPALGDPSSFDELAFEMAEVYELALLRDEPLESFATTGSAAVQASVSRLAGLAYARNDYSGRPRTLDTNGDLTPQVVFRGSSPGCEIGPYLSQFMILGNVEQPGNSKVSDGMITYGALQVSQKVPVAKAHDYMTKWDEWLNVQNGADVQDNPSLFEKNKRRFIYTPRDLATYVHYDALYEAYLNACLILLEMKTPFDPAFDNLSGMGDLQLNRSALGSHIERSAGGFALYGGPHILTLVTEVATRALKAVRFQKFNNHIRLRPEALAARIERHKQIEACFPTACGLFTQFRKAIKPTVDRVVVNNASKTALLPMAFQEGSPMHPSYGAGHATVAGACITILKAYFDTSTVLVRSEKNTYAFKRMSNSDKAVEFVVTDKGSKLKEQARDCPLTLEGELNKLAANISIGRNMAGVHYFSDYYDSLRMGEAIAMGLLEEQALCYPTDPFVLSLPTFDGDERRIGRR